MHEAGIISKPTNSFYTSTSDDLLSPINLTTRNSTTDTTGWSQKYDSETDVAVENWHLLPPEETKAAQRVSPGLQKRNFPSNMTSQTSAMSDQNNRWRFNNNGQLVDSEAASARWDLADEIVRLNIGDIAGEAVEDGAIRTPPQSKIAVAAVAQMAESSPLETASSSSVNSSPHTSEHQMPLAHSRGPSMDSMSSSQSSALSASSKNLLNHSPVNHKSSSASELKERPHSFSGGLSTADLRRLQLVGDNADASDGQQPWTPVQYRDGNAPSEQLSYPSLANTSNSTPIAQRPPQSLYDYRGASLQSNAVNREDLQVDYNMQARNYTSVPPTPPATYNQGRPTPNMTYRQAPPPRGYPQQPGVTPQAAMPYGSGPQHSSHLSLGSTQQLYDMMLPAHHDNTLPAVNRVQQQHNVFRGSHQHSASDPSALRDASGMALLNNNMQGFPPNMFPAQIAPPTMAMYPNQYYGGQEGYARPDAAQQAMAARLQAQYNGQYAMMPPMEVPMSPSSTSSGQNGPSANNRKLGLYKTELCRSWEEKGSCRYGGKCQFAHGEEELRKVSRHPKYKTEICRTFWVSGSCPYGKRCCFIHTELPTAGGPGGPPPVEAMPQPSHDGRARSMSTNSDPNEGSVSLLARISAKRNQESGTNSTSTPVDGSSTNSYPFGTRPGALRVDTSSLDPSAVKQNKSAYPAFSNNGVLLQGNDNGGAKSPGPVTAGPDLGRHANARLEIVGYQQRNSKAGTPPSAHNPRHSLNGTDDVNFAPSPPVSGHSYTLSGDASANSAQPARVNGHVRAGSAGNWAQFGRGGAHLASSFPSAGPSEVNTHSPWSTTELSVGSSRLNEKAWA